MILRALLIAILIFFIFLPIHADSKNKAVKEMTMKEFMEDYLEIVYKRFKKDKEGERKNLEKILKSLPEMAITGDKDRWNEIIQTALSSGDLRKSCSDCHKPFKKTYKKTYKKRTIQVPLELLSLANKK